MADGEIIVRLFRPEVVTFLDRKAAELSKGTNKKISRNKLINMILENEMKKDLSINRELDMVKDNLNDFKIILQNYIDTNQAIFYQLANIDNDYISEE